MAALPNKIGRYRVRDVIGTGGFATVYRAVDERFGVDVAIKVLAENRSFEPDVRERFVEEGRRLRRLRSTHLITVHDLAETERGQPYLVLELADRGDLSTRALQLREVGWHPSGEDVRTVARALTAALDTLHRHNLVHRDVAPKNLLLRLTMAPRSTPILAPGDEGPPTEPVPLGGHGDSSASRHPHVTELVASGEQLLLADLGVSKDLAAASGLTLAAGTSGFAPPEQREPGHRIDQRADIWAASALIVWLSVDRPPDAAGRWQINMDRGGWPTGFIQALTRGLAPRADDRYPTIDQWLQALEHGLQPPQAQALVPVAQASSGQNPAATARKPRQRRQAIMAIAVGGVLLTGAWAVSATFGAESSSPMQTEQLDGDTVRTTAEGHGVQLVLEGPAEATVGETVTLSARVDGTENWTWVGPDGAVAPGQPTLEVSPQTAGAGTIRLFAFDEQGQVVEARHDLQIVDGDNSA